MKKIILNSENDELYSLFKEYPNWYELGSKVRNKFKDSDIVKLYPNDYKLGEYVFGLYTQPK